MDEVQKTLDDMTEPELHDVMRVAAEAVVVALPPESGFILLACTFHTIGSAQYVANGSRDDCLMWLKETVHRFEQQEEVPR